ncbi:MAG: pilus assembly protein FimV [Candidatus Endobugula sp.]|jgi:pilus assembly protein FimV
MQLRQLHILVVILVSLLASSSGFAIGLGEVTLQSSYNEPLNAEIRLLQPQGLSKDEILVGLASREDFERIGLDRDFFLTSLTFAIVLDDPDNAYIKVTSRQPVQEPYLNFLVDMQWSSGRLLREYTVLLDLPLFEEASISVPIELPQIEEVSVSEALVDEPVIGRQEGGPVPPEESLANVADSPKINTVPARPLASQPLTFSTPSEAANDFIKKLSRQAANRESSFNIEPEVTSASPERVIDASELAPPRIQEATSPVSSTLSPTSVASQQVIQSSPATPDISQVSDSIKVKNGDTLWGLALKMRPSKSVSVQQTMLAIQQRNPEAFIGDNINMLRKGKVLRAPTLSEIQRTSFQEAVSAVKRQTQNWKQKTQKASVLSAVSPDLSEPAKLDTKEGRVTLGSANSSAASEKVNSTGRNGAGESLQNELAIAQEELDKTARENSNLNATISELEKQIQTLESLVSVTSDQLKAFELATQNGVPATASDPSSEMENTLQNTVADQLDAGKPLVQQFINAVKSNVFYLAAILLLIVLLILFFVRSKSNDSHDDEFNVDSDFAPVDADREDDAAVYDSEDDLYKIGGLDNLIDVGNDDVVSDSVDKYNTIEAQTDDVVAEADIYIGLGQRDKAEELLQKEIQQNPDNADARLALLGIYVTSQNANAFDDQYAQLLPLGNQSANDKAQSLRDELQTTEIFDVDSYSLNDEGLAESDNLVGDLEDVNDDDLLDDLEGNIDAKLENDLGNDENLFDLDTELISIDQDDDLLNLDLDDDFLSELNEANSDDDLAGVTPTEFKSSGSSSTDDSVESHAKSRVDEKTASLSGENKLSEDLELTDSLSLDDDLDLDLDLDFSEFLNDLDDENNINKSEGSPDEANALSDHDSSDESFDLDLDDELLENKDTSASQDSVDELDFDLLDITLDDGLSVIENDSATAPENTTVLTDSELDKFLSDDDDIDVSFDGDNKPDSAGQGDAEVLSENPIQDDELAENGQVPSVEQTSTSEVDDSFDDDVDLESLDIDDGLEEFEKSTAEELNYTADGQQDVGQDTEQSGSPEPSQDLENTLDGAAEVTDFLAAEPESTEFENVRSDSADFVNDATSEFDLDLPPADVDMVSLDLELDEMSAMLDDTPVEVMSESESATIAPDVESIEELIEDYDAEEGLDEGLELMAREDAQADTDAGDTTESSEIIAPINDSGDDDMDFDTSEDDVGTKLDLAQAYIDMGDFDGAEDILQEVMEEGNEEQTASAEKLLKNL